MVVRHFVAAIAGDDIQVMMSFRPDLARTEQGTFKLCAFDAKTFAFAKVLKNFGLDKFFLHFLLQIVRINMKFAYFLPSSQITFRQMTEQNTANSVIKNALTRW